MTKEEARRIPDLDIKVTDEVEDCFYLKMYLDGKLSEETIQKVSARLNRAYEHMGKETIFDALDAADAMIENLQKYGVACAEWCE